MWWPSRDAIHHVDKRNKDFFRGDVIENRKVRWISTDLTRRITADNIQIAARVGPILFWINLGLNPSTLITTIDLLPLDVGSPISIPLNLHNIPPIFNYIDLASLRSHNQQILHSSLRRAQTVAEPPRTASGA